MATAFQILEELKASSMLFKLEARVMEGVRVIEYILQTETGERVRLPKAMVDELALNKQIVDCSAQVYPDPKTNKRVVILRGKDRKITDLPVIDRATGESRDSEAEKKATNKYQYKIIASVTEGRTKNGYVLGRVTSTGDVKREIKSRRQVMELARQGLIANARAQVADVNGEKRLILRGVNCDLAKLPSIRA